MHEDATNIYAKGLEAKMQESPQPVLTIEEAASFLRLSPGVVRAACRKGEIAGLKVGKEWRIARATLEALVGASGRGDGAVEKEAPVGPRPPARTLRDPRFTTLPPLMSIQEVAEELQITPHRARQLVQSKAMGGIQMGRTWYVPRGRFEEVIFSNAADRLFN